MQQEPSSSARSSSKPWSVVFTKRPEFLRHHPGQVCFPGGRIENEETPEQAARREFQEELGIPSQGFLACGELTPLYVYASNNQVNVNLFVAEGVQPPWQPDDKEVDQVIVVELVRCMNPKNQTSKSLKRSLRSVDGDTSSIKHWLQLRCPGFQLGPHFVWGASAMSLDELNHVLRAANFCE